MRVLATLLASLLCGAAFSSAFAPLAWWWAGLAGLALQLGLTGLTAIGVRRALASQFAFGLGWFAPGLAWTANSMTEHGHMPVVAAFLGVVLLALVCSAFTAAAAGAVVRTTRPGVGRLVALTGAWTLAEWMRGPGLVHFGWLTPAEITPDLPWAGWAPLGGASAVTLALLLGAASLALLVDAALRCARAGARSDDVQRVVGATSVLALLVGAGWVAHEHEWSTPGETVTLRLLQADLPIVDVFTRTDAGERIASVAAQAGAPWPEETVQADRTERRLVVTPEGMVTTPVERLPRSGVEALGRLLDVAGAPVLFSGFRKTPAGYANTAFFGDPSGVEAYVDKRRLVPFGEYVPPGFRWFVERLGIPLSDLAEGGWDQRPNRPWGPTGPSVGVLICYENVDGAVLESWGKDVPDLLLLEPRVVFSICDSATSGDEPPACYGGRPPSRLRQQQRSLRRARRARQRCRNACRIGSRRAHGDDRLGARRPHALPRIRGPARTPCRGSFSRLGVLPVSPSRCGGVGRSSLRVNTR